MNGWKTELTAGGEVLGEVNINREISPLLFALALIPLTLVLKKMKAG